MFGKMLKMCIWPIVQEVGIALFILCFGFVLMLISPFFADKSEDVIILMILLYLIMFVMVLGAVIFLHILHLISILTANGVLKKIPGFSQERFNRENEKTPYFKSLYVGSDVIIYSDLYGIVHAIPLSEIIWAYASYGRRFNELYLGLKNGKKVNICVKPRKSVSQNGAEVNYLLRLIARKNKGVVIGYDDSMKMRFEKNFDLFLAESANIQVVDSETLEQEYIKNNYYEKDFV